jgi:hypothetical protein
MTQPMEEREQKRDPDFILRSNSISVVLTLLGLAGTVAAVYLYFPRRDNELMTRSAYEHRHQAELDIANPTDTELRAWSVGSLGAKVPWPAIGGPVEALGARSLEIQKRRTALVRYRIHGDSVSVVAQRARDPAPRKHTRIDGDDLVVSWRAGKWTMIAIGPEKTADRWKPVVGAP